jgi:hypothetical protein
MGLGTRRRVCETAVGVCTSLCAALILAAGAIAAEDAARSDTSRSSLAVPPLLGASGEALRGRFGAALRRVEVVVPDTVHEQARWGRATDGPVSREEYDLAADRAYRVRWQLGERYEHPLLNDVVARATKRFGRPIYDQTLRAKPGSSRADLRRVGWTLEGRSLELRQLHPFTGGPIFVSVADRAALQSIIDRHATPLPQPDTTGAWWRRAQRPPSVLKEAERRARLDEIDALLVKIATRPAGD